MPADLADLAELTPAQLDGLRSLSKGSLMVGRASVGRARINRAVAKHLIDRGLAQWIGSYGAVGLTAQGRAELMTPHSPPPDNSRAGRDD